MTDQEILQHALDEYNEYFEVNQLTDDQNTQLRYVSDRNDSYFFNTLKMIEIIKKMMNSEFLDGRKNDQDGYRRNYLNVIRFIQSVADKQIDLDIANFLFIPETKDDIDVTSIIKRTFEEWSQEEGYGETIDELQADFTTYGHCVLERFDDKIERVPLETIITCQKSKTMKDALLAGKPVIINHGMMTRKATEQYPDWKIEGEKKEFQVYRMYKFFDEGFMMKILYEGDQGMEVAFEEPLNGIEDFRLEEAKWSNMDGRWLGFGPVEEQIENQIARNFTANQRRRALLWSSRRIFQTKGNAVQKNLSKYVEDGQVLEVGVNGEITPVAMEARNLAELSQNDQIWEENSRQKSFTFEVNTGETMPSGTPFRLGVILSNSSNLYFAKKRDKFGFFMDRAFFKQIIPIFEKAPKEKVLRIATSERSFAFLKKAIVTTKTNRQYFKKFLEKDLTRDLLTLDFDYEKVRQGVEKIINEKPYQFIEDVDKIFKNAKYTTKLVTTGENEDINKKVETLTTLYQTMAQTGDPRAPQLLDYIISTVGEDINLAIGDAQSAQLAKAPQVNTESLIAGLTENNETGVPQSI
jgi:phage pi2 protein 07